MLSPIFVVDQKCQPKPSLYIIGLGHVLFFFKRVGLGLSGCPARDQAYQRLSVV